MEGFDVLRPLQAASQAPVAAQSPLYPQSWHPAAFEKQRVQGPCGQTCVAPYIEQRQATKYTKSWTRTAPCFRIRGSGNTYDTGILYADF